MKPRVREIVFALVLSAVLIALVAWVVVLASQGS